MLTSSTAEQPSDPLVVLPEIRCILKNVDTAGSCGRLASTHFMVVQHGDGTTHGSKVWIWDWRPTLEMSETPLQGPLNSQNRRKGDST